MPSPSDIVIVKDANIIIDLINGDLLAAWVKLGITTYTTDMVESELKRGAQWEKVEILIASGSIVIESLTPDEIAHVLEMKRTHNVSVPDGSVLHLANTKNARLLTGDRKLRLAAKNSQIQVSGLLWILDLLVSTATISPKRASASLGKIISKGARLPQTEIEKRLHKWR